MNDQTADARDGMRDGSESFRDWFLRRVEHLGARPSEQIDRALAPGAFKEAGVLAPFWAEGESVKLALTLRTAHLSSHKGQVSLPGGRRDPGDVDLAWTALRETEEELGILPNAVDLMASLDEVWSTESYVVAPHVGWLHERPEFVPSAAEVERVIVADVEQLMNPAIHRRHRIRYGGARFDVHYFDYEGDVIWGLTGGILNAFFRLLRGEPLGDAAGALTLRRYLAIQRP